MEAPLPEVTLAREPIGLESLDGIESELAKLYRRLLLLRHPDISDKAPKSRPELFSAIRDLVSYMAAECGFSENYQTSTRYLLGAFWVWMCENYPGKDLKEIRTAELTAYLVHEKKRGLSPRSIKLITVALKTLFRFLELRSILKTNPARA